MTKKLKIWKWRHLLLILVILFFMFYFHIFRGFDDRKMQNHIEENLLNKAPTLLNNLVSNATTFCIIPPYQTSESIKLNLSQEQKNYIDNRITGLFGLDDGIWWLVGLYGDGDIKLYKMAGSFLKPDFKKGKCLNQQEAVIIFSRNSKVGKSIYFNFGKGD